MLGTFVNQNILFALENISHLKTLQGQFLSSSVLLCVYICKVQKKPSVKQEALKAEH